MAGDNPVMGKRELTKTFGDKPAIAFRYKTVKGNFIEGSTDIPEDLAEEVFGKIMKHMNGEDWRTWTPKEGV